VKSQRPDHPLGRSIIIVAIIAAVTTLGVVIGEDFIIPTVIVGSALAAYLAKTEVGKALAHRIRHGPEEIEAPGVYGELDDLRNRVLELEERLDFAERMLAQPKEAERVGGRLEAEP
jgi:hypothetical protein